MRELLSKSIADLETELADHERHVKRVKALLKLTRDMVTKFEKINAGGETDDQPENQEGI